MTQPMRNPEIRCKHLFINNEWVNSASGKTFPIINPATGKKIADVQEGDKTDVDRAVTAARKAVEPGSVWRNMDASDRGRLLNRFADLIERDRLYLASLETFDSGRPFNDTYNTDLSMVIKCFRYYAGWTDKISGRTIPMDGEYLCYTRPEPVGVCGQILHWNFPLLMMTLKLAPALTCGNAVIIKPAEQTPLTALYTASLVKEAGFPAGVVNVIPGYGPTAGAGLSEHCDIDKIAFTGSSKVGQIISQAAARTNLKKTTLELSGRTPNVVFPDADMDRAVETCRNGLFLNMGQYSCTASRTYVHEDIYDTFVRKLVEKAKTWTVGDPFDSRTMCGPQVDQEQFDKVMSLIDSGIQSGAKVECGGRRQGSTGFYIQPTVFSGVTEDMRVGRDEIYGPVIQVIKFRTMDDVIERTNRASRGLAAGISTKSLDNVMTYSSHVRAGTIWVNSLNVFGAQTPIGGYRTSSNGKELGEYGLEEYSELKTVIIRTPTSM
ncbi:retinal dehydrogenase 2-like [Argopecten irradians]|uniref:retinal dehydrogenase 2-like n=1 Tax=Argopecten irradians TaxID=31199 RepID=UPI003720D332